jgi:hypothetical protein
MFDFHSVKAELIFLSVDEHDCRNELLSFCVTSRNTNEVTLALQRYHLEGAGWFKLLGFPQGSEIGPLLFIIS